MIVERDAPPSCIFCSAWSGLRRRSKELPSFGLSFPGPVLETVVYGFLWVTYVLRGTAAGKCRERNNRNALLVTGGASHSVFLWYPFWDVWYDVLVKSWSKSVEVDMAATMETGSSTPYMFPWGTHYQICNFVRLRPCCSIEHHNLFWHGLNALTTLSGEENLTKRNSSASWTFSHPVHSVGCHLNVTLCYSYLTKLLFFGSVKALSQEEAVWKL